MTRTYDASRVSVESIVASGRLGAYLCAALVARDRDQATISSAEIAEIAGTNPTQVRRDLSTILGHSGKRGVGYRPADLIVGLMGHSAGAAKHLVEAARRPDAPELDRRQMAIDRSDQPAPPATEIRVVPAEALTIGPDEVLIVKLDLDGWGDEEAIGICASVRQGLVDVGLEHRSLVVTGREVQFLKASRNADGRVELPWIEETVS